MSQLILLGSDPELFTRNAAGQVSSVSGLLGCDKWNKRLVSEDIRLQEDNVLVEFDINPHNNFAAFNDNLIRGIEACRLAVADVDHELAPGISSHIFTLDELNGFNKGVWEFGCEPDFNALTGSMNPKPKAADVGLRTAGGHVHIGYVGEGFSMDLDQSQAIVGVMCDFFLGLPSLILDPDDRRRELYGKAGAIRKKSYGMEYRTLSNFWIFDEVNRRLVWDQAHKAHAQLEGGWERLTAMVDPFEIQRVINEADKKAAEKYIKLLGVI